MIPVIESTHHDFCSHYTLTDGACTIQGGCMECPGKAFLAEKRAERRKATIDVLARVRSSVIDAVLVGGILSAIAILGVMVATQGYQNWRAVQIAQEEQ
jgi:hypothetical protein